MAHAALMAEPGLIAARILPQGQAFAVLILTFITLFLAVLLASGGGRRRWHKRFGCDQDRLIARYEKTILPQLTAAG
jgi:hypothetical protein